MPNLLTPERFFSVTYMHTDQKTHLTMRMNSTHITTRTLPLTFALLHMHLPSILKAQCFNDANLPFFEELKATETGHLFEHILLEYLCLLKIQNGHTTSTFSGHTKWNWKKDPYGTFHIVINAGENEEHIFTQALKKATDLITLILMSSTYQFTGENNESKENFWGQLQSN